MTAGGIAAKAADRKGHRGAGRSRGLWGLPPSLLLLGESQSIAGSVESRTVPGEIEVGADQPE